MKKTALKFTALSLCAGFLAVALTACAPLGGALNGTWTRQAGEGAQRLAITLEIRGSDYTNTTAGNWRWYHFSDSDRWGMSGTPTDAAYSKDDTREEQGIPKDMGTHVCGTDGLPACTVTEFVWDDPDPDYEAQEGETLADRGYWRVKEDEQPEPGYIRTARIETSCLFSATLSYTGKLSVKDNMLEFKNEYGNVEENEFAYTDDTLTIGKIQYIREQ